MDRVTSHDWKLLMVAGVLVSLLAWPGTSEAQTVTGQASAVQATAFNALGLGTTTALSKTATLSGTSDARQASLATGSVPSLLTGEALHAVTIGWPDQVASEASLGNLAMTVAGTGISADFVMARALSVLGSAGTGRTNINGLRINGIPIVPTGSPNQTIAIAGGRVVINEHVSSAGATVVNGLHVVVDGVMDVVIASAKSGIF
ncbi:MAG: hypothetical protein E6J63_14100 [Deltaproteobacteria bacterium]|nr:MAG: hypothetical protein E6J63_14100 [Deltaproteobacteria bacterium]